MKLLVAFACCFVSTGLYAQSCCSGGSASPIAGGTSQGVLQDEQAEISLSYQYSNSQLFLTGNKREENFLDNYNTQYLYNRLAYGVTNRFTMSVETGYFLNRTQIGLNKRDTVSASGFGDLILFPRYSIYTRNTETTRDEITLGLGLKMPIGKHLDSTVVYVDQDGQKFYTPKPPAVMPTTGSNDFIFYAFAYRGYPAKKFRVFFSGLYMAKGWNSLGQRFGDFANLGLYAGKTIYRKLEGTIGVKGEWVDKMQYGSEVDMLALYNLDVASTGGKRLVAVPQVSYGYKSLAAYLLAEIPLYQYVNGTAVASQYFFTLGLSYRFFLQKQNG